MTLPTSFSNKLISAGALLRWSLLAVAIFFGSQSWANAATITAQSPSFVDVSAAVALAVAGDTVSVPAGTATWNSTLTLVKPISLIGAGQSQRGETKIVQGAVDTMLIVNMVLHQDTRISGFTFQGTQTADGVKPKWINICGVDTHSDTAHGIRVDHCSFEGGTPSVPVRGWTLYFSTSTTGVVDHCFWGPGVDGETTHVTHGTWNGGSFGDKSFADDPSYGANMGEAIFFEDNIYESIDFANDCDSGGRMVERHNFYWGSHPTMHGIDTGGSIRGSYIDDVYNNIIRKQKIDGTDSVGPIPISERCGSQRVFSNYCVGAYNTFMNLYNYRIGEPSTNASSPWLGANGRNPWDWNDRADHTTNTTVTIDGSAHTVPGNGVTLGVTSGSSIPSDTRLGAIYASGTYSGPDFSGGEGTINLTGLVAPNLNCWQFYTIINKSLDNNTDTRTTNNYSIITGNSVQSGGVTPITVSYVGAQKIVTHFKLSNGDQWEIRHVLRGLDQPGSGKGAKEIGGPGLIRYLVETGQPGWSDQEADAAYAWNNKMITEAQNTANPAWRTVTGWSSAPNGTIDTSGGSGTYNPKVSSSTNPNAQIFLGQEIVNRAPTSSDPGGDYNWNASTSGGSSNPETRVGPDDDAVNFAWNGSPPSGYIPSFYINGSGGYPYPHPLTGGAGGDAPIPPQDLRILP
jgi:hypothetical protein